MNLNKLKKKTALVLLLGSLIIPFADSKVGATSNYFENYFDNPVDYMSDEMRNRYDLSLDSYSLKWEGSGNKETTRRNFLFKR